MLHLKWLFIKYFHRPAHGLFFDYISPIPTPIFNFLALRIPPKKFLTFGVARNQLQPKRLSQLELLIRSFSTNVRCLEIGTWFGQGSTQIFLKNLGSADSIFLIDAWQPYVSYKDQPRRGGKKKGGEKYCLLPYG